MSAFVAGAYTLFWTEEALFWTGKPTLHRDNNYSLHRADGPAYQSTIIDLYLWHGRLVPDEWISCPDKVDVSDVLRERNQETRRAGIEIFGWPRILRALPSRTIDKDAPEIGELIEVTLPDLARPARFLRVRCPTGREFAIGVPPDVETAIHAQAWIRGKRPEEYIPAEIRT